VRAGFINARGVPARTVEFVDADVFTVTAAADKVLPVRADQGDRVQHFDFQAGPDASLPRRIHGYSALPEDRHGLPVDSVVVLLRPEAKRIRQRFDAEAEPTAAAELWTATKVLLAKTNGVGSRIEAKPGRTIRRSRPGPPPCGRRRRGGA
jgi:hypothetical protein